MKRGALQNEFLLKKLKKVGLIENEIDNSAKNKSLDVSFI